MDELGHAIKSFHHCNRFNKKNVYNFVMQLHKGWNLFITDKFTIVHNMSQNAFPLLKTTHLSTYSPIVFNTQNNLFDFQA
jgi:hypothetical protein